MKFIKLAGNAGKQLPIIGLGTWQATAEEVENAVTTALTLGYRHIDTAFNYNNEEHIGNALKKWFESGKGKREDLFITSKLPHMGNRPKDVEKFLKMSLQRLQLNYLDLYLIHMPFTFVCNESTLTPAIKQSGDFELEVLDITETWKAMEEQVRNGLTKNIGLSNFNEQQIRKIYEQATIKPAVLQVEIHAYLQQKELRKTCDELGIAVTAYSPLGSPTSKAHFQKKYNYDLPVFPDLLGHPIVKEISDIYNKSTGQILLKHLIQQNIIVIPKSSNPKRLEDNISLFDFELRPEDIETLNLLDRGEDGRIFNFLFFKGVENHPEYPFLKKAN